MGFRSPRHGLHRSPVTGFRDLPCADHLWPLSVALYDHAEAVPVLSRYSHESEVDGWTDQHGVLWRTFVCCGPAAPLPRAYLETVHENSGQYVLTYEQRDAERVRTWRQRVDKHMVEGIGLDALRDRLRHEYAYVIDDLHERGEL